MSMSTPQKEQITIENYKEILYRLRKCIGILGLLLPIFMLTIYGKLLASMSHYYYTASSIFFVGILFSFGLVLMSYKGYKKEEDERFSDDQVTSIAGLFALITVIIPTSCTDSGDVTISCAGDYLFGHTNAIFNTIHLTSAGLFILILGWMCVYKFTRSTKPASMYYHRFYRICGYVVWAAVGCIALIIAIDEFTNLDADTLIPGYVFVFESVALYAFAIAWLVKGKVTRNLKDFKKQLFKK